MHIYISLSSLASFILFSFCPCVVCLSLQTLKMQDCGVKMSFFIKINKYQLSLMNLRDKLHPGKCAAKKSEHSVWWTCNRTKLTTMLNILHYIIFCLLCNHWWLLAQVAARRHCQNQDGTLWDVEGSFTVGWGILEGLLWGWIEANLATRMDPDTVWYIVFTVNFALFYILKYTVAKSWSIVLVSLWSPYVIGQTIIFLPCGFFFFLLFFLA